MGAPGVSAGAVVRIAIMVAVVMACVDRRDASAQLGSLVSPGRLSKAHASLEGVGNCLTCHSAGRRIAAEKCLSCHKPVAERIAARRGVHRNVTNDCVSCHVEHAGVDAELRPFDQKKFDHAVEIRFPLDGLHAPGAANCSMCHKTRSFLTVSPTCASCHQDVHRGTLGANCVRCHTTSVQFKATRLSFDHSRTDFPLTGGHTGVRCERCHSNGSFERSTPSTCASCHSDPHAREFGAACTTCHTTSTWRTTRIDHARTAFPLRGRHAAVACASCHQKKPMSAQVPHDTCATCHADPHRGTFKQDCSACHTESSFSRGLFDHSTTRFALVDGHAGLTCASCHKNSAPIVPASRAARGSPRTMDFRGLQMTCASCHDDPHKNELGQTCESCHTPKTFRVTSFVHSGTPSFYEGAHTALRCEQCHNATRPKPSTTVRAGGVSVIPLTGLPVTPTQCASCHRDVHLGQVGSQCEQCHRIATPKFALAGFSHSRTAFPLTGRHTQVVCAACHKTETGNFPAGPGTAVRLTGVPAACAACHADPHRAQLGTRCEQCHNADIFRIRNYIHQNANRLKWFFAGPHLRTSCQSCHKPATRAEYQVTVTCTNCHEDKHRGALGQRCETCHKLN